MKLSMASPTDGLSEAVLHGNVSVDLGELHGIHPVHAHHEARVQGRGVGEQHDLALVEVSAEDSPFGLAAC